MKATIQQGTVTVTLELDQRELGLFKTIVGFNRSVPNFLYKQGTIGEQEKADISNMMSEIYKAI